MDNNMIAGERANAGRHQIGTVAERTGLTPEVLRVWERRYGAVSPARSDGRQRLYSDAELEKLQLLARVTRAGRAIGLVAGLSVEELRRISLEDDEARRRLQEREAVSGDRVAARAVAEAMVLTRRLNATGLEALL